MAEDVAGFVQEVAEEAQNLSDGGAAGGAGNLLNVAVDFLSDEGLLGEYNNPASTGLAAFGGILGKILPGSIGTAVRDIFKKIADRIDRDYDPSSDGRDHIVSQMAGGELSSVTKEVGDVVGMNSQVFAADLAESAKVLKGEMDVADVRNNQIMDIGAAIGASGQAHPAEAGRALQAYGSWSEAWLADHKGEYPDAEENMKTVNKAMATYYFEAAMTAEASGFHLTEADREVLDSFHMYGVDMTYADYVKEHQAELGPDAGKSYVTRSAMTYVDGQPAAIEAASKAGAGAAYSGALADDRSDGAAMDECGQSALKSVAAIRADDPSKMGQLYMDRMAEIQAYNDGAVSAIMEKYASDPEGRLAAEAGLALRLQSQLAPMFDAMKEDQAAYGCFTKEQLERLDELQLTGVTVSYGDYQPGAGLYPVEEQRVISAEEMAYANALDASEAKPAVVTTGTYEGQGRTAPPAHKAAPGRYYEMAARELNTGAMKEKTSELDGPGLPA